LVVLELRRDAPVLALLAPLEVALDASRVQACRRVIESLYSYDKARRAGFHTSANRWALQTLAVGFPSLGALRDAIDTAHLAATSGDDLAA